MTNMNDVFTVVTPKEKIRRFYDIGSPLYLHVYSEHIHDGYYLTSKESKEEAQVNLINFMVEKAGIKHGAKVLDVGCGVGGSSIWLSKNIGAVTTGITISPVQVGIARRLAVENGVSSSFQVMDAENMSFQGTFDVIWVVAAMTHFIDQQLFIKSATKYLNRNGKFIIFDWMSSNNVTNISGDCDLEQVIKGMLLNGLFSLDTYISWLREYGYRIDYAGDITKNTIQTWSDALPVVKKPAVLKLAYSMAREDTTEALQFLKCISAMKRAMLRGKLISGVVIARKY
jgi:tocopherol O-methyltransferase